MEYISERGAQKAGIGRSWLLQERSEIFERQMESYAKHREGGFSCDGCPWTGSSGQASSNSVDHKNRVSEHHRCGHGHQGSGAGSWEKRLQETVISSACGEWRHAQEQPGLEFQHTVQWQPPDQMFSTNCLTCLEDHEPKVCRGLKPKPIAVLIWLFSC